MIESRSKSRHPSEDRRTASHRIFRFGWRCENRQFRLNVIFFRRSRAGFSRENCEKKANEISRTVTRTTEKYTVKVERSKMENSSNFLSQDDSISLPNRTLKSQVKLSNENLRLRGENSFRIVSLRRLVVGAKVPFARDSLRMKNRKRTSVDQNWRERIVEERAAWTRIREKNVTPSSAWKQKRVENNSTRDEGEIAVFRLTRRPVVS